MKSKKTILINLVLILVVIFLAAAPSLLKKNAEFSGADGQAADAITEIVPDYEPWFQHVFEPASGEIESLLFCVQAALGAGFIGYYLGTRKANAKQS